MTWVVRFVGHNPIPKWGQPGAKSRGNLAESRTRGLALPTTIPMRPRQPDDGFRDFARAMLLFYGVMGCILSTLVGAEASVGAFRDLPVSEVVRQIAAVESWPLELVWQDRFVRRY